MRLLPDSSLMPDTEVHTSAAKGNHWLKRYWQDRQQTTDGSNHEGPRLASLYLYGLLSPPPFVTLSTAVASLAFGRTAAQEPMSNEVRGLIGAAGAKGCAEGSVPRARVLPVNHGGRR
jgi:hypothetical protein